MLLELYITKVLIPLDKWSETALFVESCPGISIDLKEKYAKQIRHIEHRKEEAEIDSIKQIEPINERNPHNLVEKLSAENVVLTKSGLHLDNALGIFRLYNF